MVEFRILGPLEARGPAGTIALGGPRQRAVLAVLLLAPDRVVSLDAVVDAIWGPNPPRTARRQVQNQVSALRLAFASRGAELPVSTRPAGYLLRLEPGELDAAAFAAEAEDARRHWHGGQPAETAEAATAALRRWRGPALAGVAGPGPAGEAARLEEQRLDLLALRLDADLALGRHADIIGELTALVSSHPLRERLRGQLMTALYRAGRKVEALSCYDTGRHLVSEQFGLDPGPELTRLRQAILTDCPSLGGEPPATATVTGTVTAASPEPEVRPEHGAAPAPAAAPVQLPPPLAGFVGRTAELTGLRAALDPGTRADAGPVVLVGKPGAGTTTLAVRAAWEAAPHYPDGQLSIVLRDPAGAPVDPAAALADVLCCLGVPAGELPAGLEARAGRYRGLLAGRRMLVLIDGAAGPDQVRPLLPAAAGCAAVVTGAPTLAALEGARRWRVGPLPDADGVALLRGVAGTAAGGPSAEAAARRVVRACEGLPGAIHAAGAWLARFPDTGMALLAALLEDDGRRLGMLALADPRVRRRLRCRYETLGAQARAVLGWLGARDVHTADPDLIGPLLGLDRTTVERLLGELADAELAEVVTDGSGGIRYRLESLARCLAAELPARPPDQPRRPIRQVS
ncbi:MAG: BTAD domain-containing putative transcriptional regulator [Mycobacteriales bacterium]